MLTWLIREGHYGDVRLDGALAVVLVMYFEGNAMNRNREFGHALRNVVTGAFGRNWDWSGRSSKHIAFDLRGPDAFSWRKPLS